MIHGATGAQGAPVVATLAALVTPVTALIVTRTPPWGRGTAAAGYGGSIDPH